MNLDSIISNADPVDCNDSPVYTATTREYRNRDGGLVRETRVDFGTQRQQLRVTTRKGYGGLETCASVGTITADGCGWQVALGLGSVGDFSRTLAKSPARATPKAIAAQHDAACADLAQMLAEIVARYADGRCRAA